MYKRQVLKIGKYAICNAPTESKEDWVQFINDHHLSNNYLHVTIGTVRENLTIRNAYDAFSNPIFYLVDANAILIGKKISPSTIKKIMIAQLQNSK